jgi:hypothetical protein
MSELKLKKKTDSKRTALYFENVADYEKFEEFAESKGVSFNRAAIYLMGVGLESLAKDQA